MPHRRASLRALEAVTFLSLTTLLLLTSASSAVEGTAKIDAADGQPTAATSTDLDANTPTLPDGVENDDLPREPVKRMPPPKNARRLSEEHDVWLNAKRTSVIIDGFISLREGALEMFACTRGTKEHESVVSANTKAFLVHAMLLSIGADEGEPVQFFPEFRPASGTEIEISVEWEDDKGKRHQARAQDWVLNARTNKTLAHPFVFAGSSFWHDQKSGRSYYQADGGDFICVSNFPSAMLDIPVESTQANEGLLYVANTPKIPPLGTHVRLTLTPKLPKRQQPSAISSDSPKKREKPQDREGLPPSPREPVEKTSAEPNP